jgi:ankyrin repeat protein
VKLAVESDIESGKYGSPLQLAACAGHEKIVGLLLRYRMNVETGALHAASYQGHISVFEILRKHGHDDCKMDIQGCTDQRKRTVLHKAAMNGQCEMLRLLLTCGLNIDAVDDQPSTALHLAVERHHFNAFNLLLSFPKVLQILGVTRKLLCWRGKKRSKNEFANCVVSRRRIYLYLLV